MYVRPLYNSICIHVCKTPGAPCLVFLQLVPGHGGSTQATLGGGVVLSVVLLHVRYGNGLLAVRAQPDVPNTVRLVQLECAGRYLTLAGGGGEGGTMCKFGKSLSFENERKYQHIP